MTAAAERNKPAEQVHARPAMMHDNFRALEIGTRPTLPVVAFERRFSEPVEVLAIEPPPPIAAPAEAGGLQIIRATPTRESSLYQSTHEGYSKPR